MRRTIQQVASEEGRRARAAMRLRASNPYNQKTSPSLWDAWDRGWLTADAGA